MAAVAALLVSTGPALAAGKDAKVWAAVEKAREGQLELLKSVVNIDSGTGDIEGGRKVAAVLIPRLKALGMTIESVPAEIPGLPENTVATLTGTGKAKILMIGHIDTVFGPGTTAKWSYSVEGDHARGPGVADEKGGVIEGLYALQILHDMGFKNFAKITFLIETSEERGSPGTRALIDRLVKSHDVELNLEPGDAPDVITVWRKGSSTMNIDVKGRAAHAGVAPQDGRNAAVELIHQLATVEPMPHSGDGLTVNLTIIQAGSRYNIIPEAARAQLNVRARKKSEFDDVEAALQAAAKTTVVPDTTVTVTREVSFPPLASNPATDALAVRAQAIYAGLGLKLGTGGNGGASQSALAYEAGTPALDGLGPVGGGFHSEKEFMDLKSVTPRLYLLTKLIMDLSANPPKT
ncbi:M20/M25/M40 family metallo-hydrolase [Phenylobacterium sp. 20VBR1]|uniref:M20/M25/M40 family metallo-hydrolase n=1 Tax=Phenylobacterium glaciei TaxID=2803784 RepID=A0A941D601_9CAUL|nr:glutamate carboxypeptidase [Phenylobacterium glaciei]MBR7620783.1 M20/M25/M40 family metallo-hydrolase [Phenylobacterium glaciei]